MSEAEVIFRKSISLRSLPINFNKADINLFEHELKKEIPATYLRNLSNITINPEGLLFRGTKILEESFPTPEFDANWLGLKGRTKVFLKYGLKRHKKNLADSIWVTDVWSKGYFHWLTDVLPRLFSIQDRLQESTLLLPSSYQHEDYIVSSLKPFFLREIEFVDEIVSCANLRIPTHTAPTGNYNETAIRGVREIYTNFYKGNSANCNNLEKIYISRGKAEKRKVSNEADCIAVVKEFGFKTVYLEEYSFQEQVEIMLNARYLISNHGAGLTNMIFMRPNGKVLELRKKEDLHNNCYFSLTSALDLKYFYQLCASQNLDEDAHTADLVVDCQLLRENIECMLDVSS
jgi:hypothetical protein